MNRAFVSETRRECLRRYAIVLRLQDRGSPACAAPLRYALPASLAYRPKPSWLGRSPGQQSTGLLSFSGSPCVAWKTGAERPCSARSPGQSLRYALPASLGHRPKPSVAWAFAGTSVHRTLVFIRLTHWSLGKSPAHPWRARLAGKTATGTFPSSASPLQARCRHPCRHRFRKQTLDSSIGRW
jgi:hypothetical protein